jgi:FkbM family methyltransferase
LIQLGLSHNLPIYQSVNPFYDRFLPHFASYLSSGKVVIDVGANVGDTLFGMFSNNPNLEYVCIEADKEFFDDLKVNYQNLSKEISKTKIHLINKFIGDALTDVYLDGDNGTKKAIIGGDIKSESLDDVLDNLINIEDIVLIKTDVDGFDYDVLRSAYSSIKHKPYLFFECLNNNENQL